MPKRIKDEDKPTSPSVEPTKRRKTEKSPKPPRQTDADGNPTWHISKDRRVTISEFKGTRMISIREYYEKDSVMLPGRKGISMPLAQWNALLGIIPFVEEELIQRGVGRHGGEDGVDRVVYTDSTKREEEQEDEETKDEEEQEQEQDEEE